MLQCGRRNGAEKIWIGSVAGTFFARTLYRSDIPAMAARGGSLEDCTHGTK
jgi:hypothetical protein